MARPVATSSSCWATFSRTASSLTVSSPVTLSHCPASSTTKAGQPSFADCTRASAWP
ncbi:hypothetical protein PF002_g26923 [Phytophthora fragariae]|uniref:Uncharacterized protein n=1 Tax=Phytophthora fragariae TaxID=53985 RepID=A0A6A3Q8I2_9STRA|nr:hypothetical protein PF007_g26945 [Phytophthora fragariae]KAE9182689.1 hypothetical protein PF002_g26923 [Phytophthora fragariae]